MKKNIFVPVLVSAVAGVVSLSVQGAHEVRTLNVVQGGLTPAAAVEKVRQEKAAGYTGAWKINVSSGIHEIKETIVLRPEDSGSPEAPVEWTGEDGAMLCGGRTLEGWKARADGLWECDTPKTLSGEDLFFESLYSNGRRIAKASLLKDELLMLDEWHESPVTNADGSVTWIEKVRINDPRLDVFASMPREELEGVRFGVIAKWSFGCFSLTSYDSAKRILTARLCEKIRPWMPWNNRNAEFGKVLLKFENVRTGLSVPGTWFYDRVGRKLLYRPLPGEKTSDFRPYAATSELVSLIRFEGDAAAGKYVTDIRFKNISFTCTRADGERLDFGFVQQYQHQGARNSGAVILGEGVHRAVFDGCSFRDADNYGLWLGKGCVSNRIVNSSFVNLGSGGIWLGDKTPGPAWLGGMILFDSTKMRQAPIITKEIRYMGNLATAFNRIDNCEIANCGRVNHEACGIVMTHVSDSSITHCDIHDLYYTGISVGWTWGFLGSVAQRNTIAFNRISDIGKGVMSDMGGIYTLGASFGTCISNNVIYNIKSHSYGGWGLYNDEGSEGIVMENNLVYDTKSSSYHTNYGRGNIVRNNILVDGKEDQLAITAGTRERSVSFERNIVSCGGKILFKPPVVYFNCTYADIGWKSNIFWRADGEFELMKKITPWMVGPDYSTRINHSVPLVCTPPSGVVCDPGFINPAQRDYRLKPDSPAFKCGFKPWDFSTAGRRK